MRTKISINNKAEQLSPWNTIQKCEAVSLFPQIFRTNKKQNQNKENDVIGKGDPQNEKKISQISNFIQKKKDIFTNRDKNYRQRLVGQPRQNSNNLVRKQRNKQQLSNEMVQCPKLLTRQRRYLSASNLIPFSDQANIKNPSSNIKFLQQIKRPPGYKRDFNQNTLYFLSKLRGNCKTNSAIMSKLQFENACGGPHNYFLRNVTKRSQKRQSQLKIFAQRQNRNSNLKGGNCICKNTKFLMRKKSKNDSQLTHREQTRSYRLFQNNPENQIQVYEDRNVMLESTFVQEDSQEQTKKDEKRPICNGSKFHFYQQNGNTILKKQTKPQNRPTHINTQPASSHQLTKPSSERVQYLETVSGGPKIQKQIRMNLRKLREYLVNMPREQCLQDTRSLKMS